ncbi:hypothetical protein LZK74_23065 (plasmid) [Sinorhizobium meliloti]|nr:hypothetical protein LZK74_23065 [Sinorhizobium meliloti]WKL32662.1 hypothetical protein Q1M65_22200 [Sinorhizobium meliloti]
MIAHDGYTVTLRPSLRAAVSLESRFGFPALYRALDDFSITIISEIILAASRSRQDAAAFLLSLVGKPLFPFFLSVRQPLAELVSMLTPAPDAKAKANPGNPVAWPDFYSDLYEQATGWLGWPPETAWNATPTEIDRAYSGHIAKLKAIHRSSEDDKQPTGKAPDPEQAARNLAAGLDPEFDRMGLRALKAKIASKA